MIELSLTQLQATAKRLMKIVLAKNPQDHGAAQGFLAQLVAQSFLAKRVEGFLDPAGRNI